MLELDHLVVAAASLEQGAAWCEASFGIAPAPGGKHSRMGTHNRLLRIDAPAFPRAYLEIIAIDPEAPAPGRTRWYDLDDARMQATIARAPRLVHWVARCADFDATCAAWRERGLERGEAIEASRATPDGVLRWRITVRDDGQRLLDGALPTLIDWGANHPVDTMPASGVQLVSLRVGALPAWLVPTLPSGCAARGAGGLAATLATPRGPITLDSASP